MYLCSNVYNPDNYKRIHLIIKDHYYNGTLKSFRILHLLQWKSNPRIHIRLIVVEYRQNSEEHILSI